MNHYNSTDDIWDIEISPKTSFFSFSIKELWSYKDLLILFVKRDFSAKYKQTILGPLWHFIQPALTTLVSFILFNVVAGIGTNGQNKILFQLSGIIIWNYLSTCILNTSNTFVSNARIFGKVYFPRLITPISIVVSNLIQLGIQFILFVGIYIYLWLRGENLVLDASLLLLPVFVLFLAILGLGLGIIISSLTTKYRDLGVLVQFGIQLLMFASAVNYPMSELSSKMGKSNLFYAFVYYNPITWLIDGFRNVLLNGVINGPMVIYSCFLSLILLLIGIISFSRVERTFMDSV